MNNNTKNKTTKLAVILLAMTGVLSQIGCGPLVGYDVEVCNPDRLSIANDADYIIDTKYNGEAIEVEDAIGANFDLGAIKITDGVAEKNGEVLLTLYPDYFNDHAIDLSSFKEGTDKTFPLNIKINANYYSISNVSNGNKKEMIPVSDTYTYQGWHDDTSAIIEYGYLDNGYEVDHSVDLILLHVTDISTANWEFKPLFELQKPIITTFPDLSPQGDLQFNRETSRNWTGELKIKILKNSNSQFRIKTALILTDGTNILEQTTDQKSSMMLAECHTEHRMD